MSTENEWSRGICEWCNEDICWCVCECFEGDGFWVECLDDIFSDVECESCVKVYCLCTFISSFCCGCCYAITNVSGYVGKNSCLWCSCGCPFSAFLRQSLRKKHKIPGTCAKDCGICLFCFPCMLCQMVSEIEYGQHKVTGSYDLSFNLDDTNYANRLDHFGE